MIKSFKSLKSISSIHLTIHSGQHEGRPAQVVDGMYGRVSLSLSVCEKLNAFTAGSIRRNRRIRGASEVSTIR